MPTLIALQLLPILKIVEVGPHVAPASGKALAPSTQAGRLHRVSHVKLLHLQRQRTAVVGTAVLCWWPIKTVLTHQEAATHKAEHDCQWIGDCCCHLTQRAHNIQRKVWSTWPAAMQWADAGHSNTFAFRM